MIFESLDCDTEMATCWDEIFGSDAESGLAFGCETRSNVVLTNRLREALLE